MVVLQYSRCPPVLNTQLRIMPILIPEMFPEFIAYNEVESMVDVNGAPLPGFGRVGSPSLNPHAPTRAKSLKVILANEGYSGSLRSKALAQF
ncbi:hypothetical protein Tco_1378238 [Tanacetum coccineum]